MKYFADFHIFLLLPEIFSGLLLPMLLPLKWNLWYLEEENDANTKFPGFNFVKSKLNILVS